MKRTRIIALITALVLLTLAFASCSVLNGIFGSDEPHYTQEELDAEYQRGYDAGYNEAKSAFDNGTLGDSFGVMLCDGDALENAYVNGFNDGYGEVWHKANATVEIKTFAEPVSTHTDLQQGFFDSANYTGAPTSGTERLDAPAPVKIEWTFERLGCTVDKFIVYVGQQADLSDATEYTAFKLATNYAIYNTFLGETYYFKVVAKCGSNLYESEIGSFTVKNDGARIIKMDNLINFRDIGGYVTQDGKKVKQGLAYRSARWDSGGCNPSNDDAKSIRDVLGIVSEIDLRAIDETTRKVSSVEGVNYYHYDMYSVSITDMKDSKQANDANTIKRLFQEVFCDESYYPLDFHCWIGTDRTGLVAFMLEGLLNMKVEDIYRDYLLSNFANIGSARYATPIDRYLNIVGYHAGGEKSLGDCVYDYLHGTLGVTTQALDKVREILLED